MARKRRIRGDGNLTIGKPDVKPSTPSHVRGVGRGNARGRLSKDKGFIRRGPDRLEATARRSTGIAPEDQEPILPAMPRLTPA